MTKRKDAIEVYPPGTEVALSPNLPPAKILAVQIVGEGELRYLAAWFEGHTRHEEWVSAYELKTVGEAKKRTIGFAQGGKQ